MDKKDVVEEIHPVLFNTLLSRLCCVAFDGRVMKCELYKEQCMTKMKSMSFKNAMRFKGKTQSMTRMESDLKGSLKHNGNGINVIQECNPVSSEDYKYNKNAIRLQIRFYRRNLNYTKEVYKESRTSNVYRNE
jgi:hypothetical protein